VSETGGPTGAVVVALSGTNQRLLLVSNALYAILLPSAEIAKYLIVTDELLAS